MSNSKHNDDINMLVKTSALIFSLSVASGILFLVSRGSCSSVDISEMHKLFAVPISAFAPEPLERKLFLIALVLVPVLLFLSVGGFKRIIENYNNKITIKYLNTSFYAGSIFLFCILAKIGMGNDQNFYLINSIDLSPTNLLVLIMSSSFFYYMVLHKTRVITLERFLSIISLTTIGLVMVFNIFGINSVREESIYNYHFNSVYHAVVQVFQGRELLADLFHIYGLYPHFIEPLLKITGISVINFTSFMAILMGIALFAVYRFILNITVNKVIAHLGFITTIYCSYFFGRIATGDMYFQYHPIRFFFPALSIYLVLKYFTSNNNKLYHISFVIYSIAVLWNFDTGFVVLLSWLAVLYYNELLKNNYREMLVHTAVGCGWFTVVGLFFTLYLYFRYGQLPNYTYFFSFQQLFFKYGYMMLPMPIIHPWNLVVIVYCAGVLHSFQMFFNKINSLETKMIFFLSILGTGLFVYYQGRSHDYNLSTVCFPALLIITIVADALYKRIRTKKNVTDRILLCLILGFMLFSSFSLIKNIPGLFRLIETRLYPIIVQKKNHVIRTADFLRNRVKRGEGILILSNLSGIYYQETGTFCPVIIPGPTELFLNDDYKKIFEYLTTEKRVFIDKNFANNNIFLEGHLSQYLSQYRPVASSPDKNMYELIKP